MPPRIPIPSCLRAQAAPKVAPSSLLRTFTTTPVKAESSEATKLRRKHDPFLKAQAAARKAANLSRQKQLQEQRAASLGDPVRGITTPFVQSFDTVMPPSGAPDQPALNHFLTADEVKSAVERSARISAPSDYALASRETSGDTFAIGSEEERVEAHETAATALSRILALENGSSKDRLRVNVQRCIETFGRHNTDRKLPRKAHAAQDADTNPMNERAMAKRAGPDTGSSEVQIAILTAKIRTMANFLETRGTQDKMNKRNLRLLVHKRQKLLKYLRRKERGGPRWQNLIETLGLTEGTWKGEISL